MSKLTGTSQDIAIADIRLHPELLADLVLSADERSIILERLADVVRVTYLKTYTPETRRIVAEARQDYFAKRQTGYNRDQAFCDLAEARSEIAEQLGQGS